MPRKRPRYSRKEECEAEFGAGNCETRETDGGGSFFVPMMMGYMLGNAFRQPVYRGPDNGAMMRSGGKFYNVGTFAGAGRAAPSNLPRSPRCGAAASAPPRRPTAPRRAAEAVRRLAMTPRPDWRVHVERDLGFVFHTMNDAPYWDETACYAFTAAQVDELEAATGEFEQMALELVDRVVRAGDAGL